MGAVSLRGQHLATGHKEILIANAEERKRDPWLVLERNEVQL